MSEPNGKPEEGADITPEIEWRDPPPKILGRKPMDRPDAVEAGRRIRARLEADRRARGVPTCGTVMAGEKADTTYQYDADGKRVRDAG